MAITKIHAIKATVKGAVNYICNPDKTDSKILISSFGTTPDSAAEDFRFILSHREHPDEETKAYHLIQSFAPGEVSAAEAHQIGQELADRLLKGRYSYVVSTHTDKGHMHNHLIFCAADNIDFKKYDDSKRTYWNIRHLNDEICEEHNLSVIRENKHLAKSYKEWQESKNGTSWKAQLKTDINSTIKRAHSYEEFLKLMQEKGYEIKDSEIGESAHKYIGFRAPGQERWVRGRANSLGPEYTKERIRERIEEKVKIRTERMQRMFRGTGKMIDTSHERFADSPGLKRWAEKQNLKEAARVQSLLAEKKIQNFQDLDEQIDLLHQQSKDARKSTVALDKQIKQAGEILRYARQYTKKHKYEVGYDKSKDPERYYRTHFTDIQQALGAKSALINLGLNPDTLKLSEIESEFTRLSSERERSYTSYKSSEKDCNELIRLRDELASYMEAEQSQEIERDKKRSL